MEFSFGKAPLAIAVLAVLASSALVAIGGFGNVPDRPTLVFATFVKEQAQAYRPAIDEFEKKYNCTVQVQVVSQDALQGRLQSALLAGAEVPDMVELIYGSLGTFTK